MFISASAALAIARENLKLALQADDDSDRYRNYVNSLKTSIRQWQRRVRREKADMAKREVKKQ